MAGFDNMHYDKTQAPDFQTIGDWNQAIAEMRPDNMLPDLPLSPCVLVIKGPGRGQIHRWSKAFSKRSDICVNCDEHGNTDPAAWQVQQPPPPPSALQAYRDQLPRNAYAGPAPGATPQTHMAAQVLGADSRPVPNYTDPTEYGAAMPLIETQGAPTVADATQAAFNEGMKFKLEGSFG